jgi:hypothetical protein
VCVFVVIVKNKKYPATEMRRSTIARGYSFVIFQVAMNEVCLKCDILAAKDGREMNGMEKIIYRKQ